jgi:hypothetical protein
MLQRTKIDKSKERASPFSDKNKQYLDVLRKAQAQLKHDDHEK